MLVEVILNQENCFNIIENWKDLLSDAAPVFVRTPFSSNKNIRTVGAG